MDPVALAAAHPDKEISSGRETVCARGIFIIDSGGGGEGEPADESLRSVQFSIHLAEPKSSGLSSRNLVGSSDHCRMTQNKKRRLVYLNSSGSSVLRTALLNAMCKLTWLRRTYP